ncbi:hypothetical protein HZH66_000881 [Vespula vulgaris]|uniref:Uncharacterized protein n=1 Tax=Vespula vulgaris TaxID=7454 RepID=A0A834KT95_VESVU|nr:hypothetical protein HZH66_000881 [Vespula vulgaris]
MQQQVSSWLDVIRKGNPKMRRKALTCNNSAVCVAALGTMLKTYRPTTLLRLENEKLPKAVARIRVYTAITLDSRVPVNKTIVVLESSNRQVTILDGNDPGDTRN